MPAPTASTIPCWGGVSFVPGGTTRPELRIRSGSSSLITTWSNSGRRLWRGMPFRVREAGEEIGRRPLRRGTPWAIVSDVDRRGESLKVRTLLAASAAAVAALATATLALAADVDCTGDGPVCQGTNEDDQIYGSPAGDEIYAK